MLTAQQNNALAAIRDHILRHGHAPTLNEIGAAIGVHSKGAVHRLVQALIDKGYLQRESGSWRGLRLTETAAEGTATLPLIGRIAAGRPIEAIAGEESINLADFLLGPRRYALRVMGDSMVGIGILDGDTVIIEQADTARNGEIVVALIDDQEATLKRLKRGDDGSIALIPENPTMTPMIYPAHRVRIQGILVGQLRSYR